MTVEDKIVEFRKEFEALGYISENLIDFKLWGSKENSLEYFERQIIEGNIEEVRKMLPRIHKEFNLWMRYYRFVAKYLEIRFYTSGSVGFSTMALPQIIKGNAMVIIPSAWYGVTKETMPPKLLRVSRLINHAVARCLKHPRFRKV